MAPGRWPRAHSLSSRMSTRMNLSPASRRFLTSWTLVLRTRVLASSTSFRKPGECFISYLSGTTDEHRLTRMERDETQRPEEHRRTAQELFLGLGRGLLLGQRAEDRK